MSKERHDYCERLGYDILALTELHNRQNIFPHSKTWIPSDCAGNHETGSKQGKCMDPAAGVAIMLSKQMEQYYRDSGHVGNRIVWVRIAGPVCSIFFVAVYIPHKYRVTPQAGDTLEQLETLLLSKYVHKNDCVILAGDFNCQLRRNVQGCTGPWSMTRRNEKVGHDSEVLDLMRRFDLFAIGTKFKPHRRLWSGKFRRCNATYLPKHEERRPTKLDYILVPNRWKSSVRSSQVKWGASMHRFGKKFDHGLLETQWDWRVRTEKRTPRPDYKAMTEEKWLTFDATLKKKLLASSKDMRVEISGQGLGAHYETMTSCIQKTIKEVVSPKKQIKFDGRKASEQTRALYAERIRDFNSKRTKIKKSERKAWNTILSRSSKLDYHDWVARWVQRVEDADNRGDTRAVYEGVATLAGKSRKRFTKQPTRKKKKKMNNDSKDGKTEWDSIDGPDELGEVWREYLEGKFSATELEKAREEYEDLGANTLREEDQLTIKEYLDAVQRMKTDKAVGPDGVAAEVFKHSQLAREELYCFLQQVWRHECVPKNLVLGMFVMLHKKGCSDELSNYRALCMLNHDYKILSICLLKRVVAETEWFLSDWQAGFRGGRGCRDNILLLRVMYDNIIRNNKQCVVTYIDFAAAFDSVSHKFLDEALAAAGAKRKTRALLRAIYSAAQGAVQIRDETGSIKLSQAFEVRRGVVQGDIISPILFILALDQMVQEADTEGQGVTVGEIKELRVLGYADDAAMASFSVEAGHDSALDQICGRSAGKS